MTKIKWQEHIEDLQQDQFVEVQARCEAEGMSHCEAAIVAWHQVYRKEGK